MEVERFFFSNTSTNLINSRRNKLFGLRFCASTRDYSFKKKSKSKSITSNNKNHNIHFIITSNNIIFNSNSSFLDKSNTNGPKL